MKLSSELLEAIGNESTKEISIKEEAKAKKIDITPKSIKLDDKNDLSESTFSDFIPLKTYS